MDELYLQGKTAHYYSAAAEGLICPPQIETESTDGEGQKCRIHCDVCTGKEIIYKPNSWP